MILNTYEHLLTHALGEVTTYWYQILLLTIGVILVSFANYLTEKNIFFYLSISLFTCILFSFCLAFYMCCKWKNYQSLSLYVVGYFFSFLLNQLFTLSIFSNTSFPAWCYIAIFYIPIYIITVSVFYYRGPPNARLRKNFYVYINGLGIFIIYLSFPNRKNIYYFRCSHSKVNTVNSFQTNICQKTCPVPTNFSHRV